MSYRQQLLLQLLTSTLFVFFFNIPLAEASVIVRPPNNLGLVGYWSFDEGRGTQASDLSGGGNSGVLVNGPEWVSGKVRGALNFDGSSKRVTLPSPVSGSNISVAVWYKRDDVEASGSWRTILGHLTSNIHHLIIHQSTRQIGIFDGSSRMFNYVPPNDGNWHHYVVLYENGVSATLYVDGQYVDSIPVSLSLAVNPIGSIGNWNSGNYWAGPIDDVRIYGRTLSAGEIASLYSNTKSTIIGETSTSHYSDGLLAHWTFDGAHTTTTTLIDRVGSNDGTIYGAVPALGRIGQAFLFDGVNDYVNIPSVNPTEALTVSAWVKSATSSYSGVWQFVSKYSSFIIGDNNNGNKQVCFLVYTGGTWRPVGYGSGTGCYTVDDPENWHHFTGVYDGAAIKLYVDGVLRANNPQTGLINADAGPIHIAHRESAGIGSDHFSGLVDDVRIYNRALSDSEVRGLAGGGFGELNSSTDDLLKNGLVGFWTFDGGTISGNAVQDLSGNGNTGTIIGNPISATGKIREALEFDTVGDAVNTGIRPNTIDSEAVSFFAWIRVATGAEGQRMKIFSAYSGGINRWDFEYGHIGRKLSFNEWGGSGSHAGSADMLEDVWYHVGFVWSSSGEVVQYINGEEDSSFSLNNSTLDDGVNFYIGARPNLSELEWGGLIDDARLYNRALSPMEALQLYNMGN